MEETYLDDGPAENFERATLEIANTDIKSTTESSDDTSKRNSSSKNMCNVPFRHIDVHTFFTDRNEVVERAINDCTENLIKEHNDELVGSWLLTEISLWDTEKERLVLLATNALYSVKYDFISLKILDFNRVPISLLDTVITGDLIYPTASLAPRLSGLAEGVSSMIQCAVRQEWSSVAGCSGLTQFEPRKRHMPGMRLMWNRGQPLPLIKKWNPFAKDIPWLTYASHPLFWYKGTEVVKTRFDIDAFQTTLKSLLPRGCTVITMPIIVENYCGVGALVHNRNGLGFFKIRGKVSF
ncbi:tumor protein p63-regulated gene 1-like protein isoform X1 [Ooceraea biroi]|uniref:Tumor protein p63-regulated gene 1 protein n=1 Tax=Ooceraea biroi TaxID=2015173 RepID=A0A026X0W4_OOCBI|nr:tumor protein p63-regulated gene 1-like protein isoform X1 [Ooceraea biroi]EZA61718.1 Tumor protein p63-regulated gene 1 protein [Ooceraea biroi]